jgi:peptidoglycan hydrolase-like protein with peptidoglycan-binding domain
MSKRKKIIIGIVAFLIIAAILYFAFKPVKSEPIETTPLPDVKPTPPVNLDAFPLKVGSKGSNVKRLQNALNRIGGPTGKIAEDGDFGNQTRLKILTTLSTSSYSAGPSITETQLNALIQRSNRII